MHTLIADGKAFNIKDSETVMHCLERNGLYVPHSCRQGHCGMCLIDLVSGKVKYKSEPICWEGEGSIVACRARAVTDIEVKLRK